MYFPEKTETHHLANRLMLTECKVEGLRSTQGTRYLVSIGI